MCAHPRASFGHSARQREVIGEIRGGNRLSGKTGEDNLQQRRPCFHRTARRNAETMPRAGLRACEREQIPDAAPSHAVGAVAVAAS